MKRQAFPWRDFLGRIAVIAIPVALQNLLTSQQKLLDDAAGLFEEQ